MYVGLQKTALRKIGPEMNSIFTMEKKLYKIGLPWIMICYDIIR